MIKQTDIYIFISSQEDFYEDILNPQVEFCQFTWADDEADVAKPLLHEQTSSVKQTYEQLSEGTLILSPKVRLEVTESEVCLRPIERSPSPRSHCPLRLQWGMLPIGYSANCQNIVMIFTQFRIKITWKNATSSTCLSHRNLSRFVNSFRLSLRF